MMTFDQILFYALAVIAVLSAIMVITRRNPVHSALFLITTLFCVAGIYLQLHAEFLAAVQVIVYVGGIMVLFLFVIMLVNLETLSQERRFNRQWHIAILVSVVLLVEFGTIIWRGKAALQLPANQPLMDTLTTNNSEQLGVVLYQQYMLPFEIASFLLLVAIIGAVILAKRRLSSDGK
ncbi:MAG: NADH-quinone oxidoreductase subunit J [Acidobacteriia bacterium]|nr:NADH-quinone oxidoreductase subunit J [Terriglobia bacterium]